MCVPGIGHFMKKLAIIGLVASLVSVAPLCRAGCEFYGSSPSVVAGRDARGYFIRTDWNEDFWKPRRGYSVPHVGDYLAVEVGATIMYLQRFADR
jgi:hypothetical protein